MPKKIVKSYINVSIKRKEDKENRITKPGK